MTIREALVLWETERQVVARKQVVQLEAGRFQGTGFLIAEDKLVTALHVVAELDAEGRVRTELGRPRMRWLAR